MRKVWDHSIEALLFRKIIPLNVYIDLAKQSTEHVIYY